MLDTIICKFLQNPTDDNISHILYYCRTSNLFNLGVLFGQYVSKIYDNSLDAMSEYGICAYYAKKYSLCYDIYDTILDMKGLDEESAIKSIFNQHFAIDHVCNRYTHYDLNKIKEILDRKKRDIPLITLSITTCKRFDLFNITMNTIINCLDIEMIDEWICIDDNSSEEDRNKMKNLYPFFKFVWKDIKDKGHPRSMNLIKNMVKTPYLFHLEDDFKFIAKHGYLKNCLDILISNKTVGQCLINKNYSEIESDIQIKGGEYHVSRSGIRYYIHEFADTDEKKIEWFNKHGNGSSSNYWPHFSLRPSLIRTSVLQKVGDFNENTGHFEMEYAYRYVNNGYVSAFLEGIYSIHIGRLTSQKNDESKINAYKLNNEAQFIKKPLSPIEETAEIELSNLPINIKTYILNLDRRRDRWEKFRKNAKNIEFLEYERFSAVDGKFLKTSHQLQRIFDGNDYNMQVGAVGCASSYFLMFIELIYSDYDAFICLEDDIHIAPKFDIKLLHICNELRNVDWDIVFLGHHIRDVNDAKYKLNEIPIIFKADINVSFNISLGGTIGFLISKKGAQRLLDFINRHRMVNCIDTMMQKSANELNVYYTTTHLVFSECFRRDIPNNNLDTDIQNNFESLTVTTDQKIKEEIDFYNLNDIQVEEYKESDIIDDITKTNMSHEQVILHKIQNMKDDTCIYYKGRNIQEIKKCCVSNNILFYSFDENVIFITKKEFKRNYHIFKRGNIYSFNI